MIVKTFNINCLTSYFPYEIDRLINPLNISGRSRNLIISELRRTNLDVNLAVNNLLSRNEEDGDDGDEGKYVNMWLRECEDNARVVLCDARVILGQC